MTSVQDLAAEAEPFVAAFAGGDLEVTPVDVVPDLPGPFTMVEFGDDGRPGFTPALIAVRADVAGEIADSILATASGVVPHLTASGPRSIPDLDAVRVTDVPESAHVISTGGEVVAVLVLRSDRRNDDGPMTTPHEVPATDRTREPGFGAAAQRPSGDISLLRDVALDVSVELGRDRLTLARIMNLTIGSIVELDRAAGSPVDVRVNGILFGRGEVVVVDDEYAVRIVEIVQNPGPIS